MRYDQFSWKDPDAYERLKSRLEELKIPAVYNYILDWLCFGEFNLPYSKLDRYEAAFYAIRSVLPRAVLATYGQLGTYYRGFSLSLENAKRIDAGGLPIKSRIGSWAPSKQMARHYAKYGTDKKPAGVVLKHNPQQSEVILCMNKATREFLHLSSNFVANYEEAILSLPLLAITPDMVAERYVNDIRTRSFANIRV